MANRRSIAVVTVLVCVVSLCSMVRLLWPQPGTDASPSSAFAQLSYLRGRIDNGADIAAQGHYSQGQVYFDAMYGLAWTQLAASHPDDAALRDEAISDATDALNRMSSPTALAPYAPGLTPSYGVFYAGWSTWLQASILLLQPSAQRDPHALLQLDQAGTELAAAFAAAPTGFPDSSPDRAWPVDSAVGAAALKLVEKVRGTTRYDATIAHWITRLQAITPRGGLPPREIDVDRGTPLAGPTGGSSALLIRCLTEVDPSLARQYYQVWSDQFLTSVFSLGPGVRQYPHGTGGQSDPTSGPLFDGVSLPATVLGLAAARVQNDDATARGIGAEGELLGLPIHITRSKRYAFGTLPLADTMLVWAQTARPLAGTQPAALDSDPPGTGRLSWFLLLLILPLVFAFAWWQTGRRMRRPSLGEPPAILSALRRDRSDDAAPARIGAGDDRLDDTRIEPRVDELGRGARHRR